MTKLVWDERQYELGIDRGVYYTESGLGVVWNGLVSVNELPSILDDNLVYLDGVKTYRERGSEEFAGTIQAFIYPDLFYDDVLIQRRPKTFGLSYRVTNGDNYKIHLIYNVLVTPSQYVYQYDEMQPFSWDFTTLPVPIPGARASAHLIIDSSVAYASTMSDFEDILYGTDMAAARLPFPEEVLDIFEENAIVKVVDNGDGTFTVTGPDDVIVMLDETTFSIDWPSVVYIDAVTYSIHSL